MNYNNIKDQYYIIILNYINFILYYRSILQINQYYIKDQFIVNCEDLV